MSMKQNITLIQGITLDQEEALMLCSCCGCNAPRRVVPGLISNCTGGFCWPQIRSQSSPHRALFWLLLHSAPMGYLSLSLTDWKRLLWQIFDGIKSIFSSHVRALLQPDTPTISVQCHLVVISLHTQDDLRHTLALVCSCHAGFSFFLQIMRTLLPVVGSDMDWLTWRRFRWMWYKLGSGVILLWSHTVWVKLYFKDKNRDMQRYSDINDVLYIMYIIFISLYFL